MIFDLNILAQANATPDAGTSNAVADAVGQIADRVGVTGPQLIAQIILFTFVIIILRKYAFGPVQKVLDERRKMIDQTIENAEKVKLELAEAENARREIIRKADAQAAAIIKEAQDAAETIAQRRLQESAKEAEQLIVKAKEEMRIQQDRMETELRREMVRLVTETTQRVTGKILTPEDHQRLNRETVTQVSRN